MRCYIKKVRYPCECDFVRPSINGKVFYCSKSTDCKVCYHTYTNPFAGAIFPEHCELDVIV